MSRKLHIRLAPDDELIVTREGSTMGTRFYNIGPNLYTGVIAVTDCGAPCPPHDRDKYETIDLDPSVGLSPKDRQAMLDFRDGKDFQSRYKEPLRSLDPRTEDMALRPPFGPRLLDSMQRGLEGLRWQNPPHDPGPPPPRSPDDPTYFDWLKTVGVKADQTKDSEKEKAE